MTYTLLIALEVLFWALLLGGLLTRYALQHPRLGALLLTLAPLTDLALLGLSAADLHRGGTATFAHALAAVFIALSVTSGRTMLRTLDHLVQRGLRRQPLQRPRLTGHAHAHAERRGWLVHAATWLIGTGLMLGAAAWIAAPERTAALTGAARLWTLILAIDFLVSFSYSLWPRKPHNA
ncbi:hypothetical protein [Deinococcus maricopensis]|uniref:Integral inner membrane protein n=1 Tax=Deinococcus maricopensis (strain DSM 21211 / LMG 22137 / NRRL B-23946 / LB-34) TaxID=709986 RepID=E8U9J3_DEIML|nr:hypothetical protein [Deinococcus maricopensis]ADV67732.1 integral inner membrane protein [Deinococcus maricopensis DSM 21211]